MKKIDVEKNKLLIKYFLGMILSLMVIISFDLVLWSVGFLTTISSIAIVIFMNLVLLFSVGLIIKNCNCPK